MTPADLSAADRIVNLWLDGIGYHVDRVDIERLRTIAAGVVAVERRASPYDLHPSHTWRYDARMLVDRCTRCFTPEDSEDAETPCREAGQ